MRLGKWFRVIAALVLVPAALALPACAGSRGPGDASPEAGPVKTAAVEVRNLGFADMTLYAITATGTRVRLGVVTGNSTQRLTLSSHLVRGGGRLRFLADPIGGSRTPVSEELFVAAGETVTLTIPPQ